MVRSLWLTGRVQKCFVEKEAAILTETQRSNAKAERSHTKARKRRLRELGVDLLALRCCIMNQVALWC